LKRLVTILRIGGRWHGRCSKERHPEAETRTKIETALVWGLAATSEVNESSVDRANDSRHLHAEKVP